jgi:hypothetical protein
MFYLVTLPTDFTGRLVTFKMSYDFVGYTVAQLVEALRYKPEGRGFDFRLESFIDIILPAALWPWG